MRVPGGATAASRYVIGEALVRRTYAPGAVEHGMSPGALVAAATVDHQAARVVLVADGGRVVIRTAAAIHEMSDTEVHAAWRRPRDR